MLHGGGDVRQVAGFGFQNPDDDYPKNGAGTWERGWNVEFRHVEGTFLALRVIHGDVYSQDWSSDLRLVLT